MNAARAALLLVCLLAILSSRLFSQDNPSLISKTHQDSLSSADTTAAARRDTVKHEVSGVDTVVNYSAKDSIVYSLTTRTMTLYSNGDIKYRQMRLKSEEIDIDWDTAIMSARGVVDTSDSAKNVNGKKYRGTPIMVDGGEEYHGFELSYNFRTQQGRIDMGDTEVDQGFYHGEAIKKMDKDVLFVEDGRYTTCDAEDPHYYFFSPKMKIVMQDKVVAEPVYLYIADVPVFALPFAVFPNKGGRRSGIIAPAYGEDANRGRFLSHFGYYWAMSDYMDWNIRGDSYSKGGWAAYSDYRYALRYDFNGSLSGEYKKLHTGEENDPGQTKEESYRANITHHQVFDPTTRMDVNFTFTSNNSYLTTNNLSEALNQAIVSNATLSKSWEGTPNSMTLSLSRTQNLLSGNVNEILPSFSFNRSQSYPFRSSKKGFGGSEGTWYDLIGYSYGGQYTNNRAKVKRSVPGVKDQSGAIVAADEFEHDNQQAISQRVNVSASPKLGYFTVTPSFLFQDNRTFTKNSVPGRNPADSMLVFTEQKDQNATGSFSTGVSTGTRLYGIVQPNILGIGALRHTLTPALSFTYSKYVYGRDLPARAMAAGLNVGNVFEMKTMPGVFDSSSEAKKIQLLNLGAGMSYDFARDSLNFSPINVSFRTDVANVLNVSGGASFDLYRFDESLGRDVNKFLWKEEGRLARMTDFSLNVSTTLSGEKSKKQSPKTGAQLSQDSTAQTSTQSGYYGTFREEEPDLSIPWNLQLAWDFSENKVPGQRSRASSLRGSLSFNVTEHWKISVSGSYDVLNNQVAAPSVSVYRDLHCWEMNFNWVPIGTYRSYRVEIRLKAPQLQDVKVTKQGSSRSIY